jgi:flavin reductase (DIM6/NTAB) family NADH-FMN oxidoreductase RutF
MDEATRKKALRMIPYGLYVVSTPLGDQFKAFTISWLTQTSFEPPMVALAVKEGTRGYAAIKDSGVFCINFLAAGQKDLAMRFFRHVDLPGERLAGLNYTLTQSGCPILSDGLAWVEGKVATIVEQGDHHIFVGEITDAGVLKDGRSLELRDTGLNYGG